MMNPQERIMLKKMIDENNVKDHTDDIRNKKHSSLIKSDLDKLLNIKTQHKELEANSPQEFDALCVAQCSFLFNNYTDIFNKIKKNEIDINILNQLIDVLKKIENEEVDQHEGSYMVGKLLKEIYIDSALKKSKHLDEEHKTNSPPPPKDISWKDFKQM